MPFMRKKKVFLVNTHVSCKWWPYVGSCSYGNRSYPTARMNRMFLCRDSLSTRMNITINENVLFDISSISLWKVNLGANSRLCSLLCVSILTFFPAVKYCMTAGHIVWSVHQYLKTASVPWKTPINIKTCLLSFVMGPRNTWQQQCS